MPENRYVAAWNELKVSIQKSCLEELPGTTSRQLMEEIYAVVQGLETKHNFPMHVRERSLPS